MESCGGQASWTGNQQFLLETSFWESADDSEEEEGWNGESKMEEIFKDEDAEEDSETELDSDDEGIGSMNSAAGQSEASPEKDFVLSRTLGRRRDFARGRKGGTLGGHRVGGLLNQLKQSLQSRRGKREVFGQPLVQLLEQEGGEVPNIVRWATSLIEARGPDAWEGIYRLSEQFFVTLFGAIFATLFSSYSVVTLFLHISSGCPDKQQQWQL